MPVAILIDHIHALVARDESRHVVFGVKFLRDMIQQRIPDTLYHDDVHGKPMWRKHMTLRVAEEIRVELQGPARP